MATIKSLANGNVGNAEVDTSAFGERHNPVVLREAVLMYEANRRQGTVQTRTRRFVSGTSAKFMRQKGSGRARHGDRRAPIFRGGGVAHGPHPRDFSYSMPKKALTKALQVAVSLKFRDEEVVSWSGASLDKPSTKTVAKALESLGAAPSALIVAPGKVDENIVLSVRNLPYVRAMPATELTAYDLVAHKHLVLLDGALEALAGRVASVPAAAAAEGSE
ncbi:MAG: 50S ribosomal protein L4 [Planctomycetota bacterium]|nr:50S ribosomal protein L4 [Planctomycetota bacterium]